MKATIFAPLASSAFQERFAAHLQCFAFEISAIFGKDLIALELGGGYGRSEGAVILKDGRESPYNDLDLFAILRRPRSGGRSFQSFIENAELNFGIEVDVALIGKNQLRRWQPSQMGYDLVHGHLTLTGDDQALERLVPRRVFEEPPAIEATRLLLNRGAGLLWARRIVAGLEASPDPDFARRNLAKLMLSLGDAVLMAHGRYRPGLSARREALKVLQAEEPAVEALELLQISNTARAFKLSPDLWNDRQPDSAMLLRAAELWARCLLHVESHRLGRDWSDLGELCADEHLREPARNIWWRWPANLRLGLGHGFVTLKGPREQLFRSLPLELAKDHLDGRESKRILALWRVAA